MPQTNFAHAARQNADVIRHNPPLCFDISPRIAVQTSVIRHLASGFDLYLTLHRLHPSRTYSYAARKFFNLRVIEHTRHGSKCKAGESWVYVAVPSVATLNDLASNQRLYIGAQTQDRMFRGDNLTGENFHHAEMRRGRGEDNLESYLKLGREVKVFRIAAADVYRFAKSAQDLHSLYRLMQQPLPPRTHQAGWLEQYVLHYELPAWRWNKDGASAEVSRFLARQTDVLQVVRRGAA
jgi:hypothetical protein